jgi:hypothetical protein
MKVLPSLLCFRKKKIAFHSYIPSILPKKVEQNKAFKNNSRTYLSSLPFLIKANFFLSSTVSFSPGLEGPYSTFRTWPNYLSCPVYQSGSSWPQVTEYLTLKGLSNRPFSVSCEQHSGDSSRRRLT